jgi:hypothetical protein
MAVAAELLGKSDRHRLIRTFGTENDLVGCIVQFEIGGDILYLCNRQTRHDNHECHRFDRHIFWSRGCVSALNRVNGVNQGRCQKYNNLKDQGAPERKRKAHFAAHPYADM